MSNWDRLNYYKALRSQNVFPNAAQTHLVLAALGTGDIKRHWQAYKNSLADPMANEGERRIYPLVAKSLENLDSTVMTEPALKREMVLTTVRNVVAFNAAKRFLPILDELSTELIIIKGLALTMRCYKDLGLRASTDVDCYLPARFTVRTERLTATSEWQHYTVERDNPSIDAQTGFHSTYEDPKNGVIDIHWYPRRIFQYSKGAAERFEKESHKIRFDENNWLVPSDTWLLLETIDHGMAANKVTPLRWVTDGVVLINLPDSNIDWQQFLNEVKKSNSIFIFALAISELHLFGAKVPEYIIAELQSHSPTFLEKVEVKNRIKNRHFLLTPIFEEYCHIMRRAPGHWLSKLLGFPGNFLSRYHQQNIFGMIKQTLISYRRGAKL